MGLLQPIETLHIFPTRAAADQGLLRLGGIEADVSGGRVYIGASATTFRELFAQLGAGPSSTGGRYLRDVSCRLLVRELLAELKGGVFAHLQDDALAVRAVHEAILELRTGGIGPEICRACTEDSRLVAMGDLLQTYAERLEELEVFDDADRERSAVWVVAQGKLPARYASVSHLIVHNGAELFGSRIDLLNAWGSRGARVEVSVSWDPERSHAFTWTEASVHALESRGRAEVSLVTSDGVGDGPLAALRRAQFSGQITQTGDELMLGQATSAEEEARRVAQSVLHALSDGVSSHDVVVVTPDLDHLGFGIARELQRMDVPAYVSCGERLSCTPPGRALIQMLDLTARGYERESLIDLWQTCDVKVSTPNGVWSASAVARLLRRAGVRSLRVGGYRGPLEAFGRRNDERRSQDNLWGCTRAVADVAERFIEDLESIPAKGTTLEYVQSLRGVWMRWGGIDRRAPVERADPDGATPGGSRRVAGPCRMARRVERGRHSIDGSDPRGTGSGWWSVDSRYFLRLSACRDPGAVSHAPWGALWPCTHYISIGGCGRPGIIRFSLAGVTRGVWPKPMPRDPILGEDGRRCINHALMARGKGPRLLQAGPLAERPGLAQDARDTWLWLEMLYAAREGLVVSYTLDEASDHEGISPFVEELVRSTEREVLSWGPSPSGDLGHQRALSVLRRGVWGRDCEPRQLPMLSVWARDELRRYLMESTHSPSRVDSLGMCTYRYFASAVLRLERQDESTPRCRSSGAGEHGARSIACGVCRYCSTWWVC